MSTGFRYPMLLIWLIIASCFSKTFPQDSLAQTESGYKLKVDVDLVTVEVFAHDERGNPVLNLTKEDFRLYEDGERQQILSFDAVDGDSEVPLSALPVIDSGAMPRGKTVLILFDGVSIPPSKARTFYDSAIRFVRMHMQPRDLFAVASWDGTMRIIQNLTDDREAVLAAIGQAASGRGWGNFENMLRALEQIHYSIASIKGQKSILVYGHSSGGMGTASLSEAFNRAVNSARKAGVIYYMIDPGRAKAIELSPPDMPVTSSEVELRHQSAALGSTTRIAPAASGMDSLVAASRGFSISGMDEIDARLDKLNQQISSYYTLGFQSTNLKHTGDFRRIKITTNAKGVALKYPAGYQDRRPVDVLTSSRQEQMLLNALAAPEKFTQLPVLFRPAYFGDPSGLARVLITAKIRTNRMALQKKGAQTGADLHIMGAAYAENGAIAARFSEILPIRIENGTEVEFRTRSLTYQNFLKLRSGKYRLKLAVSDNDDHVGSMEQAVEVPAPPSKSIFFSSLVIIEQSVKLPDVVQQLRAQLLDPADPLFCSGMQIQPSVENRLPANAPVSVLFRIYNLDRPVDQLDLTAHARLLDDKGASYELDPISLKQAISAAAASEAVALLRLPFRDVPPGKYQLVIEITDSAAAQVSTLRTDLEFSQAAEDAAARETGGQPNE